MAKPTKLSKLDKILISLFDKKSVVIALAMIDDSGAADNPRRYTDPLVRDYPQFKSMIDPLYDEELDEDLNGFCQYTFEYDGVEVVSVQLFVPELANNESGGLYNYPMTISDAVKFLIATDHFSAYLKGDEFIF